MSWVKLDDSFGENPKIAQASDSALALWVTSLAYCNRNLTDGYIPSSVGLGQLRYCGGNPVPAIRELESLGLWETAEGGWYVHDYLHYQLSKDDVLAQRETTRERVTRHRNGGGNDKRNAVTTHDVPGMGIGEVDLEVRSKAFAEFWAVYPRKAGKRAAESAFERACRRAMPEVIVAGAERYRDDPNRDDAFTAHPTTWLNGDRWDDPPLPARTSGRQRSVKNILSLADRMEERP